MSEEVKMSESISLPLRAEYERDFCGEYNYHIYDSAGDVLLPCIPEDVDHELMVIAINNHDRLTEENAELREVLVALVLSSEENEKQLNDLLMCSDYGESEALCKARQLLNK